LVYGVRLDPAIPATDTQCSWLSVGRVGCMSPKKKLSAVRCGAAPSCTVLRCAARAVLCCTVLNCAVLNCAVLYCAVLCCAVLYCVVLCCTEVCCAALCCAAAYRTIL
jgi:hypothetical protein